jgi:hypothetical protein
MAAKHLQDAGVMKIEEGGAKGTVTGTEKKFHGTDDNMASKDVGRHLPPTIPAAGQ